MIQRTTMMMVTLLMMICSGVDGMGQETWVNTFGGTGVESGTCITTTSDGSVLITGSTNSNDGDFKGMNKGGEDVFIIKLNSLGRVEWKKTFGGSIDDGGSSVITTSDGGIVLTGYTSSNDGDFKGVNKGGKDIFVVNIDRDGRVLWSRTYGGTGHESGESIVSTPDGGFVITGSTTSSDGDFGGSNKGDEDIFVIKLDKSGDVLWGKLFGGSKTERGHSITTISDGGILITGMTGSFDGDFLGMRTITYSTPILDENGDFDGMTTSNEDETINLIIKLDNNGHVSWKKILGETNHQGSQPITTSADNGLFMTEGLEDIVVINIDKNGEILWKKSFGGTDVEQGRYITTTSDGDLVITGETLSNDGEFVGLRKSQTEAPDIFIVKLDKNGSVLWTSTFGGNSEVRNCKSIATTRDGGFVITGDHIRVPSNYTEYLKETIFYGPDIYVMKLDSNGNLKPSGKKKSKKK